MSGARGLRIGIVAGEASGDRLGAALIGAVRALVPGVAFEGIAGPRMREAGCHAIERSERIAVMGISEVLARYRELRAVRDAAIARFRADPPDVFVGVDSPEFNLAIERALRAAGVPTVHYVSPQVWAWRKGRVRTIGAAADLVLTLFPFEVELYRRHGVAAQCVGHPLADDIPLESDPAGARRALGLPAASPVLALLPGSRSAELDQHLASFVECARRCADAVPGLVIAAAAVDGPAGVRIAEAAPAGTVAVRVFEGRAQEVLAAADAALVASGTAALEAMLVGRPMVVAYRTRVTTWLALRALVRASSIAMPNILAGRELVPEFVQGAVQAERMSPPLVRWLREPRSAEPMRAAFRAIHADLRRGASATAARAVLGLVRGERAVLP